MTPQLLKTEAKRTLAWWACTVGWWLVGWGNRMYAPTQKRYRRTGKG